MTAQQILAELVERVSERPSQAVLTVGGGEGSLSYIPAGMSWTQSQAAAESRDLPAEQYSGDIH